MPRHPATPVPGRESFALRPRLFALFSATFAILASDPAPLRASEVLEPSPTIMRALPHRLPGAGAGHATANSNCADAACDTVWIGHSAAGPGGSFLGVHVGGVWDFDTDVAGTDSTQGFRSWVLHYRSGAERPALQRPEWALDYGNLINHGNTNLWAARDLAGRKYVRTGIAGAWHSDTMVGVKTNLQNAAEPSSLPIAGTRSAWCGLREAGNTTAQDALTGNYLHGDLIMEQGSINAGLQEFPGFCNLWDQMMYKDFASTGTGSVAFRFRTDISQFVDTTVNGTGWFNPDPTNIAHFVNNPADTFMVYVGSPNENAYDTNRRWFSEVLDLTKPYQEILAVSGRIPLVAGTDTAVVKAYSGIQPVAGNVRVVFRVKTNRVRGDNSVSTVTSYNSKEGAALVDEVQVDGGHVYGFESAATVVGRSLIPDLALVGGAWATTGKPPATPFRVANVATLIYEDLCGAVGSPTRLCNLAGNVWTPLDPVTGEIPIEGYWNIASPTIDLAVRNAAPGTKNAQGIDQATAARASGLIEFDVYSGHMDLDQSIFYHGGARAWSPGLWKAPVSQTPHWSGAYYSFITFNPDPACFRDLETLGGLGIPAGSIDSLQALVAVITQGWRFGGQDIGNTRGTYFDNFRVGLVRASSPVSLAQSISNRYQDQFPWNEGVTPGDNAAFDTTAARMNTGLNIVEPFVAPGVVGGDSIVVGAPYGAGDGVTTGTRLDLVFRIDPGPGNYSVKGDRNSALDQRDPARPFFAAYLADNGTFGTPGGHGGVWNRHVWNSARMDSAELRLYPVVSRAIGNPVSGQWMGTLHEADPKFATLGIERALCFLVNPNGANNASNISCSGTPPAVYGAVSGLSKEATKILPDGWFTPGTHIEYFVRKSTLESPGIYELHFDTTRVTPQGTGSEADLDQERWSSVDVLPDMWKSVRFGGAGLGCILMVDAADRRGADPAYRGAADTLGYGKNNGASSGWKKVGATADPNDPAGFVAANLGQYGRLLDHYDVTGAEAYEAGRPGTRLAINPGAIGPKRDTSGPSPAMLAAFYTTVIHHTGDLSGGTLHDGFDSEEPANDVALYAGYLAGSTPSNRRGLWLSGDGIMEDGAVNSDDGTHVYPFLTGTMGADFVSHDYHAYSGTMLSTVGFLPQAVWADPGRVYGFLVQCPRSSDVLRAVATTADAAVAATYQAIGPGPEFGASVYRPAVTGRNYRTLLDGFDLSHLRGHYASLANIPTQLGTNVGRLLWFDAAMAGHLQVCFAQPPVISIGDLPGPGASVFTNRLLGAYPNPAFAARGATLRFTLAAATPVRVRIFNVAGREVASLAHEGLEGENAIAWDGRLGNGATAPAGVYFYRLEGPAFEGENGAARKIILLSAK